MSSLDRVFGNKRVKDYLKRAVRTNRISHSYMIEGEKGSGKKMLAECFARILLCEGGGEADCGTCPSCRQIDSGHHPDVIRLIHEKTGIISVDEVREQLINTADVIPYRGAYKIYIIDEAEKMQEEAQNALLKTIEEPPEYVIVFLLVSNRGALLETIRSRCVLLQTGPVSRETIRSILRKADKKPGGLADANLEFAAGYAMGNVGKALETAASEDFLRCLEKVLGILPGFPNRTVDELAGFAADRAREKETLGIILDLILAWYRDLLILKATDDEDRIIFKGKEVDLRRQIDQLSFRAIDVCIREIGQTRGRLRANVNGEAAILMMLIRIKEKYRSFDRGRDLSMRQA